eukprot:635352-Rhodomonas_salina.4
MADPHAPTCERTSLLGSCRRADLTTHISGFRRTGFRACSAIKASSGRGESLITLGVRNGTIRIGEGKRQARWRDRAG